MKEREKEQPIAGDEARDSAPEPKPLGRREILATAGAAIAAGGLLSPRVALGQSPDPPAARPPARPNRDYLPVVVPNGSKLPWKIVGGAKVFHMVAEEVEHELAPGIKVLCWGYNSAVHGPVLEWVEGDRVRVYVTNRLPAATTVHWHAILVPNGMDGVGGLTQRAIQPGETFKYEFTVRQHGTGMYHSHHDEMTQMALGMTGMIVVHPRGARAAVDRDFAIMLHEWRVEPGARRPDPNEMTDFNMLTMNGKSFPGTEPLVVKKGQRVRIRIGNLSAMDHHPIHLHGYQFRITETDGGKIPESAQWPETTVLVPTGSARTIEFVANEPGDWAMHCHMTHHVMNQMGHGFPNMIGVKPGGLDQKVQRILPGYMTMGQTGMGDPMSMPVPPNSIPMVGGKGKHDIITMGGMFTVLKVREALASYDDPGWYESPPGTLASPASKEDMARDGIDKPPPADTSAQTRRG
jgi:FtsP/CotA-like multicopper oxidase with cupredoxin domain